MMRLLLRSVLLLLLLPVPCALAATEVINVDYLPLQEAASVARSQLSADGSVAILASRRMLIVDDDADHLEKVRALLKKMDVGAQQYTLHMTMADMAQRSGSQTQLSGQANLGRMAGGWVQVSLQSRHSNSSSSQQFSLRMSAGQPASMEVGTIEPVQQTQQWLSAYGVVSTRSVELVPITSGFTVSARPVGTGQVHLRITPWMQRQDAQLQGQHEILMDLGNTQTPATPPGQLGNMRLDARPVIHSGRRINISGAATELTINTGEEVILAASSGEAKQLGSALLSGNSSVGKRQFVMRLRID
ncbi:MAG: type II and III secretion system family protein [Mariprofundus sp.]